MRELVGEYPLFSHLTKAGCWRMMMVRSCPTTGESQVIIQSGLIADETQRMHLEDRLVVWAKQTRLTSLFIQYNASFTDSIALSEQNTMKHLNGPESIKMSIGNMVELCVSPLSFFQTNSIGCDLLYSKVSELAGQTSGTIFDVCCGVGSIGMYIAKGNQDTKIIGVDIVEKAIDNARENARMNGLTRCQYVCGRAESVLPALITTEEKIDNNQFLCIVDPPRVGLHRSVLSAIRECEKIQTLIYVSCNPKSLSLDLVKLCEPLTSHPDEEGVAVNHRFVPEYAVAVDMFPHTPHCEVVVKLVRPSPTKSSVA
jgi:tRNA (uracil-5-)-methyltransferase